ncbi:hypothetical protein ALC57_06160 [Trachymyrmex cornetzi]|uniref:Uncharacterized protein n=1 Tax=Trachymyrmex cornetzi TaxID=471704 RepID=A0A151J9A6_9HYME|nr:hypothetical protein ALC57_06160 [Trachymyrmex cornetzi]
MNLSSQTSEFTSSERASEVNSDVESTTEVDSDVKSTAEEGFLANDTSSDPVDHSSETRNEKLSDFYLIARRNALMHLRIYMMGSNTKNIVVLEK